MHKSLVFLKQHCPTVTPTGKVTAGVRFSLSTAEPIELTDPLKQGSQTGGPQPCRV